MTKKYKPLVIPLGRGLDQASVVNDPATSESQGLISGDNIDFGLHGGVTGRPGSLQHGTFSLRQLTSAGAFADTSVALLSDTGFVQPSMITVRDSVAGERPGIVARGRMWSYDDSRWVDRLGITQASNKRVCELLAVGTPDISGIAATAPNKAGAASWDFGPSNNTTHNSISPTFAKTLTQLGPAHGAFKATTTVTEAVTCGNGARCGNFSAILHNPAGTAKLILLTYNSTTNVTAEYTIAASGVDVAAGDGDAPVICCDYDQTVFFIAYHTTTPGIIGIKAITPSTGAVVTSTTWNTGLGSPRGLWITNTSVATNKLVAACTSAGADGVLTRVFNATTLASSAIDLTIDAGPTATQTGQVVVGAAESGQVWVSWLNDLGKLHIAKRSITAATLIFDLPWQGRALATRGGSNTQEGNYFYIQHQPINVGGRILLGLSMARADDYTTFGGAGATWSVHDITDIWTGLTTAAQLRDPIAVAKGEAFKSMTAWGPMAAILASNGAVSYRFPTVDWQQTFFKSNDNTDAANVLSTVKVGGSEYGQLGLLGLNEIALGNFQAAHFKDSTIVAGSIPRMLSHGHNTPVNFPWQESPTLRVEQVTVGGVGGPGSAESYSFQAVWSWVDGSGQKHYSAPSFPVTYTTVTTVSNRLKISIGNPHFNERETGTVEIELYCTGLNAAAGSPYLFIKRYPYAGQAASVVEETWDPALLVPTASAFPIYTSGQVLEAQCVNASGGACALGARCWVSDGHSLFASRLGSLGASEAPSWHVDGPLTIEVPPVAGRVVGLGALDDKLLAFCERGVYITGGEGPDDTDQGPAFGALTKVSDLGLSNQRGIVATPKGVAFHSANQSADNRNSTGGIWLIDRSLSCNVVSTRAQFEMTGTLEGCYLPEREQVYWASQASTASLLAFGTTPSQLLMWDLRADQWCTWTNATGLGDTLGNTLCTAAGVLWTCGTMPKAFTSTAGQDTNATTGFDIAQSLTIGNINVQAEGLRWGRVRSLSIMGDSNQYSYSYALDQSVILDDFKALTATQLLVNNFSTATWPTSRHTPEWRLPQQKCAALSITITATPAVATWTALVLEVFSQGTHAPSRQRQ